METLDEVNRESKQDVVAQISNLERTSATISDWNTEVVRRFALRENEINLIKMDQPMARIQALKAHFSALVVGGRDDIMSWHPYLDYFQWTLQF